MSGGIPKDSLIQNLRKLSTRRILLFPEAFGPIIVIIFETFIQDGRLVAMVLSILSFLFHVKSIVASLAKEPRFEKVSECIIYEKIMINCYSIFKYYL